jgi:hypothetical protein
LVNPMLVGYCAIAGAFNVYRGKCNGLAVRIGYVTLNNIGLPKRCGTA